VWFCTYTYVYVNYNELKMIAFFEMYNSIYILTTFINNQPTFYLKLEHIARCLQDRWQALLVTRVSSITSGTKYYHYYSISLIVLQEKVIHLLDWRIKKRISDKWPINYIANTIIYILLLLVISENQYVQIRKRLIKFIH